MGSVTQTLNNRGLIFWPLLTLSPRQFCERVNARKYESIVNISLKADKVRTAFELGGPAGRAYHSIKRAGVFLLNARTQNYNIRSIYVVFYKYSWYKLLSCFFLSCGDPSIPSKKL